MPKRNMEKYLVDKMYKQRGHYCWELHKHYEVGNIVNSNGMCTSNGHKDKHGCHGIIGNSNIANDVGTMGFHLATVLIENYNHCFLNIT